MTRVVVQNAGVDVVQGSIGLDQVTNPRDIAAAAAPGDRGLASDAKHVHAIGAAYFSTNLPLDVTTTASAGDQDLIARWNHVHKIGAAYFYGSPGASPSMSPTAGAVNAFSRGDHGHVSSVPAVSFSSLPPTTSTNRLVRLNDYDRGLAVDTGTGWLPLAGGRVSVAAFGAGPEIFDGNHHKLSERYSTLGAAQAVYSFATTLDHEILYCACRKALESSGGFPVQVDLLPGTAWLNNVDSADTLYVGETTWQHLHGIGGFADYGGAAAYNNLKAGTNIRLGGNCVGVKMTDRTGSVVEGLGSRISGIRFIGDATGDGASGLDLLTSVSPNQDALVVDCFQPNLEDLSFVRCGGSGLRTGFMQSGTARWILSAMNVKWGLEHDSTRSELVTGGTAGMYNSSWFNVWCLGNNLGGQLIYGKATGNAFYYGDMEGNGYDGIVIRTAPGQISDTSHNHWYDFWDERNGEYLTNANNRPGETLGAATPGQGKRSVCFDDASGLIHSNRVYHSSQHAEARYKQTSGQYTTQAWANNWAGGGRGSTSARLEGVFGFQLAGGQVDTGDPTRWYRFRGSGNDEDGNVLFQTIASSYGLDRSDPNAYWPYTFAPPDAMIYPRGRGFVFANTARNGYFVGMRGYDDTLFIGGQGGGTAPKMNTSTRFLVGADVEAGFFDTAKFKINAGFDFYLGADKVLIGPAGSGPGGAGKALYVA